MKNHITCLDGIRGLLALWVFWGHICTILGPQIPILRTPALAVDLFMLLSGFLMAYHWENKKTENDDLKKKISAFWIRRFFRIAPLYYCLLFVSFWFAPYFLETAHRLDAVFPPLWAASCAKFTPATDPSLSLANILSHISFTFGLFPRFASNNALPDWSLSLEMQFYLFFPWLMTFIRRSRILPYIFGAIAISVIMSRLFGLYLENGPLGNYPQPSVILFKIHIFAAGMILGCLASHRGDMEGNKWLYWLAYYLCLLFVSKIVSLIAILIAALIFLHSGPVALLNKLLSNKVFKFLGDISYSVYLIHVMLLYLFLNQFLHWRFFVESSPIARFSITVFTITPVVFIAAYGLHKLIEIPGIEIGRNLTRRKAADINVQIVQDPAL